MVPGSPLSKVSQYIIANAENQTNEHIQKNHQNIFNKYAIDIMKEELFGYKLSSYLDVLAFGDAIIHIISTFRPNPAMKDFVMAVFSDAISACEMVNGSIKELDNFMVETTIPKYGKLCGINGQF